MSKPSNDHTIQDDLGNYYKEGDRAYNYYSMKPGRIGATTNTFRDGVWFDFHHDDGTMVLLNGQRICSFEHARRMGWPNA